MPSYLEGGKGRTVLPQWKILCCGKTAGMVRLIHASRHRIGLLALPPYSPGCLAITRQPGEFYFVAVHSATVERLLISIAFGRITESLEEACPSFPNDKMRQDLGATLTLVRFL